MDILNVIVGALPSFGPAGILLIILIIVGKWWIEAESRHKSELERINTSHDAELAELRADIAELRQALDQLRRDHDEERAKRHAAEDRLHEALTQGGGP